MSKDKIGKIAVLGLGGVGELAATMLHDAGFSVTGVDVHIPDRTLPFGTTKASAGSPDELSAALVGQDAVLSCLPYHLNKDVARAAHKLDLFYFDLTEDVSTTQLIMELAETSSRLMAPQCGLAPGFVGIVGAHQAEQFEQIRSIKLRVGALPQHPTGLLAYSFNWSPEGVVNEYLNDCEVIEDGEHKWTSPMEWVETVYVNGVRLEAFTTSGGLGTMCDTYRSRVENLDYKTMRYPGHARLMNFFFHELLMREDRELAGKILKNAKPPVAITVTLYHLHYLFNLAIMRPWSGFPELRFPVLPTMSRNGVIAASRSLFRRTTTRSIVTCLPNTVNPTASKCGPIASCRILCI